MRLRHLMTRVFDTPLLIEPEKGRVIAELVLGRAEGARLQFDEVEVDRPNAANSHRPYPLQEGIAVIPIHGTLVQRTLGLDALSGLTSYARIQTLIGIAQRDPGAQGILLDISSPGGEVDGAFELADWIANARGRGKPMWAVGTGKAASSGYLLGRATERFLVGPGTLTGSIGVLWIHVDHSRAEQEAGIVVTELYAGAFKADGSPHRPLEDPARGRIQALLDRLYGLFVERAATWSGVSAEAVRATEGGVFVGQDAVDAGLVDGIMRVDQAVGAMRRTLTPGPLVGV